TFSGVITAFGGSGFGYGGAGSIFLRTVNQTVGQLTFDNNGTLGAPSTIGAVSLITADLTLKNGAVVSSPSLFPPGPAAQTIRNLLIKSNAWLVASNVVNLSVNSATLEPGGGISGDGTGSPAANGQGAGHSFQTVSGVTGSGAGHG